MFNVKYNLSWGTYHKSICKGLGSLQEKGEFVDMTLAADGHYVKVHKLVMSLVSPYIKDLITSANCAHPVIFLNNVPHTTLANLLEYIYTGEIAVNKLELEQLLQAGRALHIKGLVDLDASNMPDRSDLATTKCTKIDDAVNNDEDSIQEITAEGDADTSFNTEFIDDDDPVIVEETSHTSELKEPTNTNQKVSSDTTTQKFIASEKKTNNLQHFVKDKRKTKDSVIQYTLSNQGNLQMILNRYLYYVRYIYKQKSRVHWRCVHYVRNSKCPAYVVTENEKVLARGFAHNHPFEDQSIMKKISKGTIFSMFKDAEIHMNKKLTPTVAVEETTHNID